jgi:hypothetical protein
MAQQPTLARNPRLLDDGSELHDIPRGPGAGDSGGITVGDYAEIQDDPNEIKLTDDGSGGAFVDFPGQREESTPPNEGFYDNLCKVLPSVVQSKIVTDLLRRIEDDIQSREERDKQYEEAIKRSGMGKDAPGGAQFQGASRVVHPMVTEAVIDFQSRVMKEIWPPGGPVKPKVIGKPSHEKEERGDRIAAHMNWQVTHEIKEARSVLEKLFAQVSLGGSQFLYQYYEHRLKRPCWQMVTVDKVHLPARASDYYSAHRRTWEDTISEIEFKQRVESGLYEDDGRSAPPSGAPNTTRAEAARMKVEGVSDSSANLDGDRKIYTIMSYLEVTEDMAKHLEDGGEKAGELYPYLITVSVENKQALAIYRDWEDKDPAREPIEHLFEFPFVPFSGPFSIGLTQIIGSLSAAATGALRALLDSAHAANAQGGYALEGSSIGGQTPQTAIGELTMIKNNMETNDIRKMILPFSTNQPAPVLFQLLGFLIDSAKNTIRTSMDEMVDATSPTPVGTQVSRVEEGLTVFSAIFGRTHAAFNRVLGGLFRLNRLYMPKQINVEAGGKEVLVRRSDYEGPEAIQPTSDATVFSEQQRWAQVLFIQSRAQMFPQLYKLRAVEEAALKLIKWADIDGILKDEPQPHELNQVNENLAMALGQPVVVFPEQDHLAHLQVLLDFMQSPVLGGNPLIAQRFLPAALKHAADHILYAYVTHTVKVVSEAAQMPAHELMSEDTAVKALYDQLLAQASQEVVPGMQAMLAGTIPVLMKAQQQLQAMQPPPPVDPAAAAVAAAAAETQRKTAADQATHALATQDQMTQAQLDQQKNAILADRNQTQRDTAAENNATKLRATEIDAQTARDIASEKIASGSYTQLTNGESFSEH